MDPPTSTLFTASVGLSCSNCNKVVALSSKGCDLRQCGGCRRTWYCSTGRMPKERLGPTQGPLQSPGISGQWNRRDMLSDQKLSSDRPERYGDMDDISTAHNDRMVDVCEKALGSVRTDLVLRIEARMEAKPEDSKLTPCPSPAPVAKFMWTVRGGLSQCDMNRQIYADAQFRAVLTDTKPGPFMWRFIPRQSTWTSLKDLNWDAVVGTNVRKAAEGTPFSGHSESVPGIRLVSSLASTAMTILYALEQLNTSTAWTKKSMLIIHMIGSPQDFLPRAAYMYEAILHRLPGVQRLSMFFLPGAPPPSMLVKLDTCSECRPRTGQMALHYTKRHYESFVHNEDDLFMPPDLCIAANSAIMAKNDPALWRRTIELLVARGIPSVFTEYTRAQAEHTHALLRECGASLLPALDPAKNPFGDPLMMPIYDRVHGFYAPNAWFAGGFR
ncbi:hypothetical protein C8R44DRAFT_731589 [Mycena epipterygia]|nr:hypothetical protein C8R44DRAFT_731589 [Mycena epipterygia]